MALAFFLRSVRRNLIFIQAGKEKLLAKILTGVNNRPSVLNWTRELFRFLYIDAQSDHVETFLYYFSTHKVINDYLTDRKGGERSFLSLFYLLPEIRHFVVIRWTLRGSWAVVTATQLRIMKMMMMAELRETRWRRRRRRRRFPIAAGARLS